MADAERVVVRVETHPELGEYLVTSEGKPLYRYLSHERLEEVPYAEAWPDYLKGWIGRWSPLLASVEVDTAELDPDDFRTLPREDALQGDQATYRGHQLYTFAGDEAGEIGGRVAELWEVVSPSLSELLGPEKPAQKIANGP